MKKKPESSGINLKLSAINSRIHNRLQASMDGGALHSGTVEDRGATHKNEEGS